MERALSHRNAQYRVGGDMPSSWGTVTEDERQSARLLFESELADQLVDGGGADPAGGPERRSRPPLPAQPLSAWPRRWPPRASGTPTRAGSSSRTWRRAARCWESGRRRRPGCSCAWTSSRRRMSWTGTGRARTTTSGASTRSWPGAGVPYLLAVLPRPCKHYLDPDATGDRPLTADERELLARACAEGAEPAVHGLTHRTRARSPRRHCELCGLSPDALAQLLDRAAAELAERRSPALGLRASLQPLPRPGSTRSWRSASPSSAGVLRASGSWASRARRSSATGPSTCPPTHPSTARPARSCPRCAARSSSVRARGSRSRSTWAGRRLGAGRDLERLASPRGPVRASLERAARRPRPPGHACRGASHDSSCSASAREDTTRS